MNLDYQEYIPADFPDDAKVWVYQSGRILSIPEALHLEKMIQEFSSEWNTHGALNKGFVQLLFGQFLVLMADESAHRISGCSIDSSVRFIKEVEKTFSVNLFDRQSLAFIVKDKVQIIPMSQVKYAADNGFINGDTLFFNNLVASKKELLESWIIPVKSSWLGARYGF